MAGCGRGGSIHRYKVFSSFSRGHLGVSTGMWLPHLFHVGTCPETRTAPDRLAKNCSRVNGQSPGDALDSVLVGNSNQRYLSSTPRFVFSVLPVCLSYVSFQFVLLLAMFVKPMMISHGGTQSGGAIYRRLVARNIACTVAVVLAYAITTAVVVLAVLHASPGSNQVRNGDVDNNMGGPSRMPRYLWLTGWMGRTTFRGYSVLYQRRLISAYALYRPMP